MRSASVSIAAALVMVACASSAAAQPARAAAKARRFTVSAGLLANGGYDIGDRNAELRPNSVASSAAPFTLFHTETVFDRVAGFEARVAYALNRRISIEAGGGRTTPQLNVSVTQDGESSGTTLIGERVSQYNVDLSAVIGLPWVWQGGRFQPYVIGGGGYLRQLHEDRLLVETGQSVFGGAGVRYAFRAPGRSRPLGIRAEARLVRRTGGIDFEDRGRTHPSISALAFIGF